MNRGLCKLVRRLNFERFEASANIHEYSTRTRKCSVTTLAKLVLTSRKKIEKPWPFQTPKSILFKPSISNALRDANKALTRISEDVGNSYMELSLVLCDEQYMRYLNYNTRNVYAATDVLAFEPANTDHEIIGDIAICLASIESQAKYYKHSERTEFRILLVHGLLHLLGYDHERSKTDQKAMLKAERNLMEKLGWNKIQSLLHRDG